MELVFIDSIHQLERAQWNRLCPLDYPFVRHEFLAALEDAKCTLADTGWQPQHLLVYRQTQLIAILPGYVKTHSYGEYVFDRAWADAYQHYGQVYYPKWVNAIPFSPCYGPRILAAAESLGEAFYADLASQLKVLLRARGCSGWHSLFVLAAESAALQAQGLVQRLGCQFHWFNRRVESGTAFQSFAEFVATMSSRKRKNIVKERRQVKAQGFIFYTKQGAQITAEDLQLFYQLYRNTYMKRSGHAGYLSADFFQRLGELMADNLVLVQAFKNTSQQSDSLPNRASEELVAAALYLRDGNNLYGRYWGCFEEYNFLHFETCYYQGIDYAIAQGLQRFDGGAQGEHKVARGFEPVLTYSNHWLADARFQPAIADFVRQEALGVHAYADEMRSALPFNGAH
jgi:uncharacterized protein